MSSINDAILGEWRRGGERARQLMANIPEALVLDQSGGLVNHPVWCLGHLSLYHDPIVSLARGEAIADPSLSAEAPVFANGSKPAGDPKAYPALAAMIERFAQGHARVEQALAAMDPSVMEQAPRLERWAVMGDTAAVLLHLTLWHEAHHLCEIAAWKKVHGLTLLG